MTRNRARQYFVVAVLRLSFVAATTALSASLWLASDASATNSTELREREIAKISVVGNKVIPSEDILVEMRNMPGSKFDRALLYEDVNRIGRMGWFKDVEFVPSLNAKGTIDVLVKVKEYPTIHQVRFSGNDHFDKEYLLVYFESQLGKPKHPKILSKAIDSIEQDYVNDGFRSARVLDCKEVGGTIELTISEGFNSRGQLGGREPKYFREPSTNSERGPKDMSLFYVEPTVIDDRNILPPMRFEQYSRHREFKRK